MKNIVIIGAGPVGLAAASHVIEYGMKPIVLEAGPEAGHAVRQWQHVQLFSPWEYNTDKAAERLLSVTGWKKPDPEYYPTGGEFLAEYLEPLANGTVLKQHIQFSSRATAISRAGLDKIKTKGRELVPFEVRYVQDADEKAITAAAVIDASGTWFSANPAGANGLYAIGEREASGQIAYGMPDVVARERMRYANRKVAVLGAGHSAIGTLIDLASLKDGAPDTEVVWLLRGDNPEKSFGGGANDKLAARGELGAEFARLVRGGRLKVHTGFKVSRIEQNDGLLAITDYSNKKIAVDELIVATGFRPDFSFLEEIRLSLDPALDSPVALAPLIDPNEHSCGTVRPHGARELSHPDHGFYIAGMKSYGRAPTFLMLTGYEQVRSIVADIAGDREAAERVELVLPETGVCSTDFSVNKSGCCG